MPVGCSGFGVYSFGLFQDSGFGLWGFVCQRIHGLVWGLLVSAVVSGRLLV